MDEHQWNMQSATLNNEIDSADHLPPTSSPALAQRHTRLPPLLSSVVSAPSLLLPPTLLDLLLKPRDRVAARKREREMATAMADVGGEATELPPDINGLVVVRRMSSRLQPRGGH
ncbi:hypothetical protein U9M48_044758 [Paspalum notatum var. saurae]|uniref:Uncharacterized protein n=1 Tax=Paspalum notatum var. saurae TaxID=547442 RepID=A0AAQ3V0B5_PASNO